MRASSNFYGIHRRTTVVSNDIDSNSNKSNDVFATLFLQIFFFCVSLLLLLLLTNVVGLFVFYQQEKTRLRFPLRLDDRANCVHGQFSYIH